MAPVHSKLSPGATVCAGFAFLGLLYLAYRTFKGGGVPRDAKEETDEIDTRNRVKVLLDSLESQEEDVVLGALCQLSNLTAFGEFQILVREYYGLTKIRALLCSRSVDIKIQALNVVNNLAMDIDNQTLLREIIPSLVGILKTPEPKSERTLLAVTRVLTNMTTLDQNHDLVIPHLIHLFEILKVSNSQIKLQILKILVNLSTNQKNTEDLLEIDLQIINAIDGFIAYDVPEDILLRALTCLANILLALNRRWQGDNKKFFSASEFVPVDMPARLEKLGHHSSEEIQMKSRSALSVLRGSLSGESSRSLTDAEIVNVLCL